MPSAVERVPLAQFEVTTGADRAQILDVAERGMQVAKRAMQSSMRLKDTGDGFATYSIVGPGGVVEQVRLRLMWEPAGEGGNLVRLVTGNFLTNRSTFMFIPLTPKMVPGLGSLERFSAFVRSELERRTVVSS